MGISLRRLRVPTQSARRKTPISVWPQRPVLLRLSSPRTHTLPPCACPRLRPQSDMRARVRAAHDAQQEEHTQAMAELETKLTAEIVAARAAGDRRVEEVLTQTHLLVHPLTTLHDACTVRADCMAALSSA